MRVDKTITTQRRTPKMARKNHATNLTELLLQCMTKPGPMWNILKWLCSELMEADFSQQLRAERSERAGSWRGYHCGYRPRRLDARMGTMYLSWFPRFAKEAIYRSLSPSASEVDGFDPSGAGSLCAGRIHTQDVETGQESEC